VTGAISNRVQFAFTSALAIFLFVSWLPDYLQTADHDTAFNYTYQLLFLENARFNSGEFYTTGPWSFLYYAGYFPPTFAVLIAGQILLAVAIAGAIVLTGARHIETLLFRVGFILACLAMFSISKDSALFFLVHAPLLLRVTAAPRLGLATLLLLASVGLAMLVKGNILIVGVLVAGYVAVSDVCVARRFPMAALVITATFFCGSWLAGLGPEAIVANTLEGLLVNTAYVELLAEQGPAHELFVFALVSAGFLLLVMWHELRRDGGWGVVTVLAYGALWFVIYKQAFVRQDGQHMIRGYISVLTVAAAYILCNREHLQASLTRTAPRLAALAQSHVTIYCTVAAALALAVPLLLSHPSFYQGKLGRLAEQATGIRLLITHGADHFDKVHAASVAKMRENYPLPPLDGAVAGVSSILTPIVAHNLRFEPLPTVAPHLATTPLMEDKNIAFLHGRDAPDYVLADTYLRRPTGRALLESYVPIGLNRQHAILKRTAFEKMRWEPLQTYSGQWFEAIPVPASTGGIVVAKIHYARTTLNEILSFFYQGPVVQMETREGDVWGSRLLISRAQGAAGLTVSPASNNIAEFAALATSEGRAYLQGRQAGAMRLKYADGWWWNADNVGHFFQPEISVSFFNVTVPERPVPQEFDRAQWDSLRALMRFSTDTNGGRPVIDITPSGALAAALTKAIPIMLERDAPCDEISFEAGPDTRLPARIQVDHLGAEGSVQRHIVDLREPFDTIPLERAKTLATGPLAVRLTLLDGSAIRLLGCG
jgi:hypothetical protein